MKRKNNSDFWYLLDIAFILTLFFGPTIYVLIIVYITNWGI